MISDATRQARERFMLSVTAAAVILAICLAARHFPEFVRYDDAGYPDSYILHTARNLLLNGKIYHSTHADPMVPAIYGPATYLTFAFALKMPPLFVPWFWPRMIPFLALLASAFLCADIARLVYKNRRAGVWGFLLAVLLPGLGGFFFQARGDRFACFLSLAAIRLLLAGRTGTAVLAGVLAGLAPLYKLSYASAMAAGVFYLLWRQRRFALPFTVAAVSAMLSGYQAAFLAEPFLPDHQMRFFRGVLYTTEGWAPVMRQVLATPALYAFILLLLGFPRASIRKGGLLVLHAAISFLLASLALFQAGGNINYFLEPLLSMAASGSALPVVLAAKAGARLLALSGRLALAGIVLAAAWYVPFPLRSMLHQLEGDKRRDRAIACLENIHQSHRVLSFVPRLSLFDRNAPLTEPFLLEMLASSDPAIRQRLHSRISAGEFDVVFLPPSPRGARFRGIRHVHETTLALIQQCYVPVARTRVAWVYARAGDSEKWKQIHDWIESRCPDAVVPAGR